MPYKRSIEQVAGYEVVPPKDSGIHTKTHENGTKMILESQRYRLLFLGNGMQLDTPCQWRCVCISA